MRRVLAGFGRLAMAVLAMVPMLAMPAQAAKVVVMTPGTVNAAMAQLRPGDTLRLEGDFTSRLSFGNRDFGGVVVDGRDAKLIDGISLRNVHNITFMDLRVGTANRIADSTHLINVDSSSHISFARANVVGFAGLETKGLRIVNSSFATVRDSVFDGLHDGIILSGSTDSLLTRNRFINGGSDGIKMPGNQRVIVSGNSCRDFVAIANAHPDCMQFWSIVGQPLQSDIYVLNNAAFGDQHGFVGFGGAPVTGTHFTFAGNYTAISRPHSINCNGCSNSRFIDNIAVTLPSSRWRTQIRVPTAPDVLAINNQMYDLRGMNASLEDLLPARQWSTLVPSVAWQVGSRLDDRSWHPTLQMSAAASAGSAPEPSSWLMMALGFLGVGRCLRRRPSAPRHVLA